VYYTWTWMNRQRPFPTALLDAIRAFDEERQRLLQKRLEWEEPQRSTIDLLTRENEDLRDWKRRAETFLLGQGLSLPPE
jgi:hypothetical protein